MSLHNTTDLCFIVSSVRSGSTFLRLMLNSHPHISNPGECDFLFDLVEKDGSLPNTPSYVKWLASNRIFLAKKLNIQATLSSKELIYSFVDQMRHGDSLLTMNIHRNFYRIPFIFPNARFIHLQRDPRDVANSCIGMGWAGHVYYGVDIWQEAEESWMKLRSMLKPNQYLEIRYEDIVSSVESNLSVICKFLGLEYSDLMMSYLSTSTYAAPDKNLCFQWKRKLSPRELQLLEGKLHFKLDEIGYEPSGYDPAKPGLLEKLKLVLINKIYKFRFQKQRYGLGLTIEIFLANKTGIDSWQMACRKRKNRIDIKHLK